MKTATKRSTDQSKVSVSIHEHFYFNKNLSLPTVIKEYERIEKMLTKLGYLACITIRFDELARIGHLYGSTVYNNLLHQITSHLLKIHEKEFREADLLVMDVYDDDTFVIFLSPPRKDNSRLFYYLERIAERVRMNLEKEFFALLYPFVKNFSRPTIGYGLEIHNPMVSNIRLITQLIRNAKKTGDFMAVRRHHEARYALQRIIIERDITVVFQPIVNIGTLEIIGYEALSRGPKNSECHDPTLMFTLAMECGLSFELDRLCRKKALESARALKTDRKIFVNTLSMTVHDPEFRGAYLKELLMDLRLKPENVVFEVSEKLAIENYSLFRESLKDYADLGIVHAGDDIGAGHSGLERIMELNPGYLKIDMSFSRDISHSFIKQEIVRAIVTLAGSIGSKVIAEGIQTREELIALRDLGVHYGQGFLFARPSSKLTGVRRPL